VFEFLCDGGFVSSSRRARGDRVSFRILVVPVTMNSYNRSCHLFWLFEPSLPEFVSCFGAARALLVGQHLMRVTVNPYALRLHVIVDLLSLGFKR
jgi:hypothetical protein